MFAPTALLIVTHNITGMKYFCKTIRLGRLKSYKGSGIAWRRHLAEHGSDVTVEVLGIYDDEQECLEKAKAFSIENDIVASDNWANLVEELGKNGASLKGEKNPFFGKKHPPELAERLRLAKIGRSVNKGAYVSPEHRAKLSAALKGRKNPAVSAALKGRKLSDEVRAKLSRAGKGRVVSDATREKIRLAAIRQWAEVRSLKQFAC